MSEGIYVCPCYRNLLCLPLLQKPLMRLLCVHRYAWLRRSRFSLLHKPVNIRVELWIVSGSEFHIEGPEVAKLCDPLYASCRICHYV